MLRGRDGAKRASRVGRNQWMMKDIWFGIDGVIGGGSGEFVDISGCGGLW